MKKNYFLKYVLILIVGITTSSLFGQVTMSDQEQLIKQCLTFKPLQDKIPDEVNVQMDAYSILNNDVNVTLSSTFKIDGKSTVLISDEEVNANKPYFVFDILNVENGRALVEYRFIFTKDRKENILAVYVEFAKNNSEWKQYNYYIAN